MWWQNPTHVVPVLYQCRPTDEHDREDELKAFSAGASLSKTGAAPSVPSKG